MTFVPAVNMGAVFFLGFVATIYGIMLIISGFFFILSMIFMGIWLYRKNKGLDKTKRFKVLFIVFLVLSLLLSVGPILFVVIGGAIISIGMNMPPPDYVNPGVSIVDTAHDIGSNNCFHFEDETYVRMSFDYYRYTEDEVPVAKVPDQFRNIYEVENDSGYRILRYNGYCYCKEDEIDDITDYYENLPEYEYYIFRYGEERLKIDDFSDEEYYTIVNANGVSVGNSFEHSYFYISRESSDGVYNFHTDITVTPSRVYACGGSYNYQLHNDELERKLLKYAREYERLYPEEEEEPET